MIQTRRLENVRIHQRKQNKADTDRETEEEYRLKSTRLPFPHIR